MGVLASTPTSTFPRLTMTRSRVSILFAAIFAIGVIAFIWIRQREREQLRMGATPAYVTERIADWRRAKFEPIPATDSDLRSRLDSANFGGNARLSETQKAELIMVLGKWMRCYAEGTYEAYHRFRLDYPHELDLRRAQPLIEHLEKYDGAVFVGANEEKLAVLWEKKNTMKLPKSAFSSLQIEVREVEKVVSEQHLIQSTSLRFMPHSQTLISLVSPVVYRETPATIAARKESLVYCVASIVFQHSDQSNIIPVTVLFYWSDREKAWFPWHMAFGNVVSVDVSKYSLWF